MELILRFLLFIVKLLGFFIMPIVILINKLTIKSVKMPPIQSDLLKISAVDLAAKIRNREVTSEEVVAAYIRRIKEVDIILNAVVANRFDDAIQDARKADHMVQTMSPMYLLTEYPLLGVPFTVKQSCSVKGLSYCVGSVKRKDIRADRDGIAVSKLRAAGGIPLLVSNTPEFCYNWESDNFVSGRSLNPFDTRRSPGGSSGGEGALIGAGASLFGVGSDIAGSIRLPALFCGVFGHKPTGGLISLIGHFPYIEDKRFLEYLVIGPIARYAKDLPTLLYIMAGDRGKELRLSDPLFTKDIRIFYMEDAGFSWSDIPVLPEIKVAMWQAIKHFERNGLVVTEAPFKTFQETLEMGIANLFSIANTPSILQNADGTNSGDNLYFEILKAIVRQNKYTFPALIFTLLVKHRGFLPKRKVEYYIKKSEELKHQLLNLLGDDGVLFYPTYPISALHHNQSSFSLAATIYPMVFNWLGFPSTHIPLGKDKNGMPIGIQVAAAPMQDRLCLCIAGELEAAFGGWTAP